MVRSCGSASRSKVPQAGHTTFTRPEAWIDRLSCTLQSRHRPSGESPSRAGFEVLGATGLASLADVWGCAWRAGVARASVSTFTAWGSESLSDQAVVFGNSHAWEGSRTRRAPLSCRRTEASLALSVAVAHPGRPASNATASAASERSCSNIVAVSVEALRTAHPASVRPASMTSEGSSGEALLHTVPGIAQAG